MSPQVNLEVMWQKFAANMKDKFDYKVRFVNIDAYIGFLSENSIGGFRLFFHHVGLVTSIFLFLLIFYCSIGSAQTNERILLKSTEILNEELYLEFEEKSQNGMLVEYIPEEEDLKSWSVLFSIRLAYGVDFDPKASAASTVRNINNRKGHDPIASVLAFKSSDEKSYIVDFLVSQGNIFEHNVMRFFRFEKGVARLQIARRLYYKGEGTEYVGDFIDSARLNRNKIYSEIMNIKLDEFIEVK